MRLHANQTFTVFAMGTALLLQAGGASAGIHTWDVNEVFSNADGTIQFVELFEANGTAGEVGVGSASITSNTQSVSWTNGAVTPPTTNKFYLIATQSFADLPGAPTPDAIIPPGTFFNTAGDTVSFLGFDSWNFGAVPTNGTDSLHRLTGVGLNSPTNYLGTTASVDASVNLPALSTRGLVVLSLSLFGIIGFAGLWRRSAVG